MERRLYSFLPEPICRCPWKYPGSISDPLLKPLENMGTITIVRTFTSATNLHWLILCEENSISPSIMRYSFSSCNCLLPVTKTSPMRSFRTDGRVAALMSLRTYALYNRALSVTVILCLSIVAFVTCSVVSFAPSYDASIRMLSVCDYHHHQHNHARQSSKQWHR